MFLYFSPEKLSRLANEHRWDIAPSPSALLLLYLVFSPEEQLNNCVNLWVCLCFILRRNVIMLQGYSED